MAGKLRSARALFLVATLTSTAVACGGKASIAQTADAMASKKDRDPDALPKALDRLKLTQEQQEQVKALFASLKKDLAPARAKRDDLRAAMVSAVNRCEAEDSRLHIESSRMIEAGEGARPFVLDAVNAFHGILTPTQRALLVDPIVGGERSLGEDTSEGREEGLGKIAEALDLGFLQKVQLIKRAVSRLSVTTSETGKLRDQALIALAAFKKSDFDVRQHAIAEAPLVDLYTRFIRDLAQVVLPVLDEDQCRTAAGLLRRVFSKNDKKR